MRETRVTGIMSHVFIGLSLLFIDQLQLIPRPVLDGLFLYLAVTALHCNQLFERIMLLVTEQVRATVISSSIINVYLTSLSQRQRYTLDVRSVDNIITGPPDGPVLFCTLSSVSVVCRGL